MSARPVDQDPRVALGRALKAAGLGTGPRLVALALWTYADWQTGAGARPSTTTLSTIVGRSVRDVRRFLRELEDAGILESRQVSGRATHYRVVIHTPGPPDPGSQGPRVTGTPGQGGPPTPGPPDPPPRVPVTPRTHEPNEPNSRGPEPQSTSAAELTRTALLLLGQKMPGHRALDPAVVEVEAARLDGLGWTPPALAAALGKVTLEGARNPAGLAVSILRGLHAPPRVQPPPPPTPAVRCAAHGRPYGRDGTAGCGECPDQTAPALAGSGPA